MSFSSLRAPFVELRKLLADDSAASGAGGSGHANEAIHLAIGAPRHRPPDCAAAEIEAAMRAGELTRYPPTEGIAELRQAIAAWLKRRFGVAVDPARHILPVSGTREALFLIALCARQRKDRGDGVIFMPDPGYQCYWAAALAAGAEPVHLAATQANGFLPDLDALEDQLARHYADRALAFYLCSPANPQGMIADADYLARSVDLARRYDFLMIVDECYAEIYDTTPPPSILEAAGDDFASVLAFHSLSKRSNLPGLRSGFCAGDSALIERFRILRELGAVAMPLPTQRASAAIWADDAHVAQSRDLYRRKFDLAEKMLARYAGFYRPQGGFFLWFDVSAFGMDDEAMTVKLWRELGISVLPGSYLSQDRRLGKNYIRIALVADEAALSQAFTRCQSLWG